jgi:hypothetical protein
MTRIRIGTCVEDSAYEELGPWVEADIPTQCSCKEGGGDKCSYLSFPLTTDLLLSPNYGPNQKAEDKGACWEPT